MLMIPMESSLKRNIRLTVISGAVATIAVNLTNPFFSLFVIRLGGSDYHVAWLSALPAFAAMLALIPGGAFIDRFTYKKNITCLLIGANRFFFLTLALVPFLPPLWQATVFVFLVGLMRFPGSVGEIAWQSFFADFVPEAYRGYAMAQRSRVATMVGLVITFSAGQILSRLPKTDLDRTHFYQGFFLIAFLISIFEVYTNMRIKEPGYTTDDSTASLTKTPLKKRFTLLFSSFQDTPQAKRFLIFAICSIIFHFGWQMGWPLFGLYQIKHLHATESWLAIISVVGALASVLTYTFWSRFSDQYGNDFTLTLTGLGMSLTPILYALSPNLPILAAMNLIVGISTAGFTLILANITLAEAPRFQRTLYIACYSTLINVSAVAAPNVGVFFTELWGIKGALYTSAFFRFVGVVAFYLRYRYHTRKARLTEAA